MSENIRAVAIDPDQLTEFVRAGLLERTRQTADKTITEYRLTTLGRYVLAAKGNNAAAAR